MVSSDDEVKLAVAPCGSSEKNCWGWEGVSIFRSVCADRPQENDWSVDDLCVGFRREWSDFVLYLTADKSDVSRGDHV